MRKKRVRHGYGKEGKCVLCTTALLGTGQSERIFRMCCVCVCVCVCVCYFIHAYFRRAQQTKSGSSEE